MVDLITTSIAPTTWDEVGGPGSIDFFAPTLDFVLATTDDVHAQIDDLLSRLRKLPIIADPSKGHAAMRGRPVTLQEAPAAVDRLLDILQTTCSPTTWDEVGGPGTLSMDGARLALIISNTAEVHESISEVLTLLRRSRLGLPPRQPLAIQSGRARSGPLVERAGNRREQAAHSADH